MAGWPIDDNAVVNENSGMSDYENLLGSGQIHLGMQLAQLIEDHCTAQVRLHLE